MSYHRNSEDRTFNERGKHLLDFAREANLKILNGATIGDVMGRFTCLRYNGNSVVDYMLASNSMLSSISFFKVLDFTDFSDHRPIKCRLKISQNIEYAVIAEKFIDQPQGYLWDQTTSPMNYREAQDSHVLREKYESICLSTCSTANDVVTLNEKLIDVITDIANSSLELKKSPKPRKRRGRKPAKNKWFDLDCIKSRIELRKACKKYCTTPLNEEIRKSYYIKRKEHKQLIKRKKGAFYYNLNKEIEEDNNIKWESLKKLQRTRSDQNNGLDLHDFANFYTFFKELYSKQSMSAEKISDHKRATEILQSCPIDVETEEILNSNITMEELCKHIAKLKRRKAAAEDKITNELLIYTNPQVKEIILKVFNESLNHGVYPWNTALITPLHKKGDKSDPNNYRAIAVGSNLGKLFSGILLERLISFRNTYCPDPINQLGFVKDAQTNDHILTLTTCINKYVQGKKRLYTCFIDYQKAFDTVCREALMLKLSKLGIKGKFFDCVSYMYKHSTAKIKLLNKVSEAIDILIGTEQGHPMSPELFKTYLLDMSNELNKTDNLNVPELNGIRLSHLLWADDLVLLSLDKESLQELINRVHSFCLEWGLTVNIKKTAVMVFNKTGKHLLESHTLNYGETRVPSARSYCYLGIVFSLSGSFAMATDELRKKGLKAYFALKRMIDLSALSPRIVFKLFDALILPVVSYGSAIWLQGSQFARSMLRDSNNKSKLKQMVTDPMEKLHLKFLKWTLLVHKKCANMPCYGDSGRYPLFIKLAKHATSYFNRLDSLNTAEDNSLVRHAFAEQKCGKLSWYTNMTKLLNVAGSSNGTNQPRPSDIETKLEVYFNSLWREDRTQSSKLNFYNKVKDSANIKYELFLDLPDYKERKCLMQLRSSSHRLNWETGRYTTAKDLEKKNIPPLWTRRCEFCTEDEARTLLHLPFGDTIVEDELHVLITCPRYHGLRTKLQSETKSLLLRDEDHWKLFQGNHLNHFAHYVKRIWKTRFTIKNNKKKTTSASCR